MRLSLMHAACTRSVRRAELVTHVIEPVPENKIQKTRKGSLLGHLNGKQCVSNKILQPLIDRGQNDE